MTGLFSLLATFLSVFMMQNPKNVPDPHHHVVAVHEGDWNTELAPDVKIQQWKATPSTLSDTVVSPNRRWLAFLLESPEESGDRVLFRTDKTGETYECIGVPLPYRPISDLAWADSIHLVFDRWSQPHYGIHYVIDVEHRRLVLAAPFPDEFFYNQQRDTSRPRN